MIEILPESALIRMSSLIETLPEIVVIGTPAVMAGLLVYFYKEYRNSIKINYETKIEQLKAFNSLAQTGNINYVVDLISSDDYMVKENKLMKKFNKKQKISYFQCKTQLNKVLGKYVHPSL